VSLRKKNEMTVSNSNGSSNFFL